MNKFWLIVRREYFTRVRKRSFIIGTLLAPVGLLIYFIVIFGLTRYQSSDSLNVVLLDEGGLIKQLPDDTRIHYQPAGGRNLEELKEAVKTRQIDGVLRVPPIGSFQKKEHTVYYYSDSKLAPEKRNAMEKRLREKLREFKIDSLRISRAELAMLETEIAIDPESVSNPEADESKYTAGVGMAVGGIMAFVLFFMVLMYGQMVMRSVMEEKVNRVVEVMMSSVRPFELMLGKIVGAGAVGLTQVIAWVVLSFLVTLALPFLIDVDPQQLQAAAPVNGTPPMSPEMIEDNSLRLFSELSRQNWLLMIVSFIIFFLGGYFIYASLFAAVGSAMSDDLGEGQALTLPITIPIILAVYITSFAGVRNPDSALMVFSSIFPLFSPITMPFRMAFNPPVWQVILSIIILIASAIFFVWLSGRIYRVGILLYGKKVTFKELSKWMFYKY